MRKKRSTSSKRSFSSVFCPVTAWIGPCLLGFLTLACVAPQAGGADPRAAGGEATTKAPVSRKFEAAVRLQGAAAFPAARARTLVLYDTTGSWGFLGDIYGQQAANLASHFGEWDAEPVTSYSAGEMNGYTAVLYLGSTYNEPLPKAFLADVRAGSRPVIWSGSNVWQLAADTREFSRRWGWMLSGSKPSAPTGVVYKGIKFERSALLSAEFPKAVLIDPHRAQVLATATRADGGSTPWAIRSGNLTYLAEVPFSYMSVNDRYLIFADLLFDALAPSTPPRHRALIRIEDVGPESDPGQIKALVDVLFARGLPFAMAVYPAHRDPLGAPSAGRASRDLRMAPGLTEALAYAQSRGGTLIMHGYSHQFGATANPYSGTSADDFEFFRAHISPDNYVVLDGPVPGDSRAWAQARLEAGLALFKEAGLAPPALFETPHYAASVDDYQAIQDLFGIRYDRGLYFPGWLRGAAPDYRKGSNQFFPYLVRDVYGSLVIPENLGNVIVKGYNHTPARRPEDLLDTASRNLAIRDGFASFFYHPILGPGPLAAIADGLIAQGWTFVSVSEARR